MPMLRAADGLRLFALMNRVRFLLAALLAPILDAR